MYYKSIYNREHQLPSLLTLLYRYLLPVCTVTSPPALWPNST